MIQELIEKKDYLKVTTFLKLKKVELMPHIKSSNLYEHFLRTHKILKDFDVSGDVLSAALCHSLYSTQYFKSKLIIDRSELKKVIGEKSEELVHIFSIIDRNKFGRLREKFYFKNIIDGSDIILDESKFVGILHLIIANQLDHVSIYKANDNMFFLEAFLPYKNLLSDKVRKYIERYSTDNRIDDHKNTDKVKFIAHAGVMIKSEGLSIVLDPWLYPSDFDAPVIKGFTYNKTIDFLIPVPKTRSVDIVPDIVLLSHFHTHHAPLRELAEFAANKKIEIVCPPLTEKDLLKIDEIYGENVRKNMNLLFIKEDAVITRNNINIRVFTHTQNGHLCYVVETPNSKIAHIVDAAANEDHDKLSLSSTWEKLNDINPDILFIGTASHISKKTVGVDRDIIENMTLSPVQAAKLSVKMGAKNIGAIGIYNHSIWNGVQEYVRPPGEVESNLYWVISYLSPSTKFHAFKPGDTFEIENNKVIKV
jgi:hypothetical protein